MKKLDGKIAVVTEEADGQGTLSWGSNPCPVRAASRREAVKRSGTWVQALTGAESESFSVSVFSPAPCPLLLLTGASKGIGASIAKHLAAVVVNYPSSKEAADRVVIELYQTGCN